MENIGIVCAYTPNIAQLVEPLTLNKKEYAEKYNYKFFHVVSDFSEMPKDRGFFRVYFISKLMNEYPNIEWFVWMDNDTCVMNFNIKLEQFIDNEYDFIIGEDWNGINSGVFFIHNNQAGKQFFIDVYNTNAEDFPTKPKWWAVSEQCAFDAHKHSIKTKIVHHSLFNGYLIGPEFHNDWRRCGLKPSNPNWQVKQFALGDFLLHLVGTPLNEKEILIPSIIEVVIK